MALYLVRHGETAGNAARVFQTPSAPLSERGRAQAERLAARLAEAGIRRILASDYVRARETAEALRRRTGARLEVEPLLRERNFGALRGTPYAALDRDPFAPDYVPPDGEGWPDFHTRVERAWARVLAAAAEDAGHLAVVTHGLVCLSLARRFALPEGTAAPAGFANTALSVVDAAPPHRVTLLGCTAHLAEPAPPGAPA